MEALNYILFLANIIMIVYLSKKIRLFSDLLAENREIQRHISMLVQEQTRIAGIIFDDLDTRISRSRSLKKGKRPAGEESPQDNERKKQQKEEVKTEGEESTPPVKEIRTGKKVNAKKAGNKEDVFADKVWLLKQQGLSIQEIAEKLDIPQGEIKLQINLQEKMKETAGQK